MSRAAFADNTNKYYINQSSSNFKEVCPTARLQPRGREGERAREGVRARVGEGERVTEGDRG